MLLILVYVKQTQTVNNSVVKELGQVMTEEHEQEFVMNTSKTNFCGFKHLLYSLKNQQFIAAVAGNLIYELTINKALFKFSDYH